MSDGDLWDVRGAVYVPARAYNAYQAWRDYERWETERDLGYARTLNLNALRVFLSYEYWCHEPDDHEEHLEHLLNAAAERDVGIVPILFESAGRSPGPETLTDRDPLTAAAVRSPGHVAVRNLPVPGSLRGPYGLRRILGRLVRRRSWWDETAEFVVRVLDRFGGHPALLALEVMNEPGGWEQREAFARAMSVRAREHPADVPLTMGCKTLANNDRFAVPGLDVHQFHYNVPPTADDMGDQLALAREHADVHDRPVWLTEWQRTREEPPPVLLPNYESLAPLLRDASRRQASAEQIGAHEDADLAGDFLWSLLLKPAYLPAQRRRGRLNGIFHEDGAVYSLADARAVAGDPTLELPERRAWPDWADDLAKQVGAPRPE